MIYDILPVNTYLGNNTCNNFEFDFYIENENQLKVYLFDENDNKFELTNNIDYKINELKNKNGSFITFPITGSKYETLKNNQKIVLELNLKVSQETQYNNSSLLNLSALEYSFDYLTRLIQILKRKIDLCVKVEECSEVTPQELINSINKAEINVEEKSDKINSQENNIISLSKENESNLNKVISFKNELLNTSSYKFAMFDIVTKDHLEINNSLGWNLLGSTVSKTMYEDFYNKCLEEKNESVLTEITKESQTASIYIHSNGHQFYDISEKDKIDIWYNKINDGWYYGIDEINEKIILPRYKSNQETDKKKYIYICTGNTPINTSIIDASMMNSKIDELNLNKLNKNDVKTYIKEEYVNYNSGYHVYSNDYCVQWGHIWSKGPALTIALLKNYKNAHYTISVTACAPEAFKSNLTCYFLNEQKKPNSFGMYSPGNTPGYDWCARGFIGENR